MATATMDPSEIVTEDNFRVCPDTNFRVHKPTEPLIIINAVMAVLTLSIGGFTALLMGLHKSPGSVLTLLETTEAYYRIVNIHGFNMLIFWVIWFEVAAMYFVSTVLLNSPLYSNRMGWASFGLMLLGTVGLNYIFIFGRFRNIVMFTAYHPLTADPMFYVFYILYAVGVLVAGLNFFLTVYQAKKTGTYPHESLPLVVYGVFVAVVIAVQAILNGAIVLTIGWLYSMDFIGTVDADLWKQLFWGFGHTAQYINITATAAVWYTLIAISTGAKPLNEKYSRVAFLFYLVFTVPVATHHLIVDPAYSMTFKIINATILALGLAIPSLIHAFVIPGALEKQVRVSNPDNEEVTGSLFGWMRELPWKEHPAIPALIWSVFLFGIGGITGSIQGTYQLNMITHNTLRINAHFHLTVVAGTTIAFMALAYYVIELIPRRKIILGPLKSYQISIYAIGLLLLSTGMFIAGVQGAPRRTATYDTYARAGFPLPNWNFGLWMLTVGALIAVAGGIIFVFLIVVSLFFGEKTDGEGDWTTAIPGYELEEEEVHDVDGLEAPGTFGLGVLFMILFAVFYIVTFLILSLGWDVGRITYP